MIKKYELYNELNKKVLEKGILNYQGVEIRRFVAWPNEVNVDLTKFDILSIITENTSIQRNITSTDLKIGNFEILECSRDGTFKIQSYEYCLDLYERF
jgi:hypothetical protein